MRDNGSLGKYKIRERTKVRGTNKDIALGMCDVPK